MVLSRQRGNLLRSCHVTGIGKILAFDRHRFSSNRLGFKFA
jgi:hypothetical protein